MTLAVRAAIEADFLEVFRLVNLLHESGDVPAAGDPWEANAENFLSEACARNEARVLVVDDPSIPGRLVAVGAATVVQILPSYWLPNGKLGHFQWIYSEEAFRGQGLATRILEELGAWLQGHDILWAYLFSSSQATSLYQRKGFVPSINDSFWWKLQ